MSKKTFLILSFIFFISLTTQQICSSKNSKDDCKAASSMDMYGDKCCWYKSKTDSSKTMCKKVPYSASIKLSDSDGDNLKYDVIDGELYEVDCDNFEDQKAGVLSKCAENLEDDFSLKKCKKYSSYVDSCCYYSGKKKDQNYNEPYPETKEGCYWLGAKFSGDINWGGLKLSCKGEFLKNGKILMMFQLLMIIMF